VRSQDAGKGKVQDTAPTAIGVSPHNLSSARSCLKQAGLRLPTGLPPEIIFWKTGIDAGGWKRIFFYRQGPEEFIKVFLPHRHIENIAFDF
jgi:hypothetical protein